LTQPNFYNHILIINSLKNFHFFPNREQIMTSYYFKKPFLGSN